MSAEKAFAALGIGALGSVGTYFAVVRSGDTGPVLVFQDDKEKGAYSDKIGKTYDYLLVAADNEANKDWWNERYTQWNKDSKTDGIKDKLSEEFGISNKVKNGFEKDAVSTAPKPLNQICKSLYQSAKTEIDGEANNKKRNSLFTYCSILRSAPKTVKDLGTTNPYNGDNGQAKIGKQQEESLLSTSGQDNDKLWTIKHERFLNSDVETANVYFKKRLEEAKSNQKKLKNICHEAYDKPHGTSTSTDTAPKTDEVKAYCSL